SARHFICPQSRPSWMLSSEPRFAESSKHSPATTRHRRESCVRNACFALLALATGLFAQGAFQWNIPSRFPRPILPRFVLSAGEKKELIAVLGSLTDKESLNDPALSDPCRR